MALTGRLSRRTFVKFAAVAAASPGLGQAPSIGTKPSQGKVVLYPVPSVYRDKLSTKYRLIVNGQAVPVLRFVGHEGVMHTAQFVLNGSANLTVETGGAIESYDLGPANSVGPATVTKESLRFDISGPKYLVLQVNKDKELLCILAEPPEADIPDVLAANVVDVTRQGIDNTGRSLMTAKVQGIIERVSAKPGGVVYFPPGSYRVGTIELCDNTSLYLAGGAVLIGSMDEKDFQVTGAQERGTKGHMTSTTLVHANGKRNVRLFGRGVLDGNAWECKATDQFRTALNVVGCTGVRIEGVTVTNSNSWTAVAFSRDVRIEGLKSLHDTLISENDALDICSCSNVDISHSLLMAGDDSFCVKATHSLDDGASGMASTWGYRGKSFAPENITLRDSVLFSSASAIKIGIQAYSDIRNVTCRNLDVVRGRRGLSITHEQGNAAMQGILLDTIRIDQIRETRPYHISNCPVSISYGRSSTGVIRNVVLRNVTIREWGPSHSDITATAGIVDDVQFRNVVIAGIPVTSAQSGHIDVVGKVGKLGFSPA
jgi:polygalacturonase